MACVLPPKLDPTAQLPTEPAKKPAGIPETHIHDLPDDTLVHILRSLSSGPASLPMPRTLMRPDAPVRHPLQCALVCRRWRSLSESAIRDLNLTRLSTSRAAEIRARFALAATLTLGPNTAASNVARALPGWKTLKQLNLLCDISGKWKRDPPMEAVLSAVRTLPTLQRLSLRYCHADDLPRLCSTLGEMTQLTSLDLEGRYSAPLPVGCLPKILERLVLQSCGEFPDSFGLFAGLRELRLHGYEAEVLPESLGRLTNLTRLEVLDARRLGSLPGSFGGLGRLAVLRVSGNVGFVTAAVREEEEGVFPRLSTLVSLTLEDCTLRKSLGARLESLEELCVKFWELEESHLAPPRLRCFEGSMCHPTALSLGRLSSSLQVLRLRDADVDTISGLGTLTGLTELDIRRSVSREVSSLPETLANLTRLQSLSISDLTFLKRLPDAIGELQALRRLKIAGCPALRALPEGLGKLGSLEELEIERCRRLKKLPETIERLGAFQLLRVRGCGCEDLEMER